MKTKPFFMIVFTAGVVALAALATPTTASAGLIIGSYDSGNCYPFSCGASDGRTAFQQVYEKTQFSGPMTITDFSIFGEPSSIGSPMDSASYDVYFSTTSKAVGGLDTTWVNNIGGDNAFFGTYTLGGAMPMTMTFAGTPFYYDPSAGNLLMHVNIYGLTVSHGYQSFFKADYTGLVTSRMWATGPVGDVGLGALVTEFNGNHVPDGGSTIALLGLAMMAVASARRKFGI